MPSAVSGALTTGLGGFATDSVAQLVAILPVALPVTIGIALLFGAIGWFRAIAHV
jgi:type IV secretory pathway VirB2 component (pilin)